MSLTELRELVTILQRRAVPDSELFEESAISHHEPRYRLYSGIKNGIFTSAEQAAEDIYHSTPNDNRFKLIKSRLKQHLLDVVFTHCYTDENLSAYKKAEREIQDGIRIVKVLLQQGASNAAFAQAEKLIDLSVKGDFCALVVELSQLCRNLSLILGKSKETAYYSDLSEKYRREYAALQEIQALQDTIILIQNQTGREDAVIIREKVQDLMERARQIHSVHPTYQIRKVYYLMECDFGNISGSPLQSLEFGYKFQELLLRHSIVDKESIAIYAMNIASPLFLIGGLDESHAVINKAIEQLPTHSHHWYLFMMWKIYTALVDARYTVIDEVLQEMDVRYIEHLSYIMTDKLKGFLGYSLYLHEIGLLELSEKSRVIVDAFFHKERFSTSFGYELEVQKLKNGRGVSIMLLELLFAVENGDAERIFSMQERMRLYYYRGVNDTKRPRARALLHLLQILLQEEFNIDAVYPRAESDLNYLQTIYTLPTSERFPKPTHYYSREGWEIIRSEDLWKILLQRVQNQQRKGRLLPSPVTKGIAISMAKAIAE